MNYWRIKKKVVHVRKEIYDELRKSYRKEKYQEESKKAHGVLNIEDLGIDLKSTISVEDVVERKILYHKLHYALNLLDKEDFDFINRHYFENIGLSQMAQEQGITYYQCWYMRKKITKKLRALMDKID